MNAAPAMKERISRIKERFRQPGVQLLTALIAALAVIAVLIANTIFPVLREETAVRLQHAEMEKKLRELEQQPLPERVDPAAVQQLALRVPMQEAMPEFMQALQQLESESGAVIRQLSIVGGQQQEKDLVTEYLELQNAQNAPGSEQEGTMTDAENALQLITPIRLTLNVQGSYEQILNLMDGIQSIERIAAVESWNLQPDADPDANPLSDAEYEPVQMTMNVVIYKAPALLGKFPELQQPGTLPAEERRHNPIIGEQRFLDMLRQSSTTD